MVYPTNENKGLSYQTTMSRCLHVANVAYCRQFTVWSPRKMSSLLSMCVTVHIQLSFSVPTVCDACLTATMALSRLATIFCSAITTVIVFKVNNTYCCIMQLTFQTQNIFLTGLTYICHSILQNVWNTHMTFNMSVTYNTESLNNSFHDYAYY